MNIHMLPNALTTPRVPVVGLLRLDDVLTLTSMRKSTLYAQMREGTFPKPIAVSARKVAWRHEDVQGWLESRTQAQRAPASTPVPATIQMTSCSAHFRCGLDGPELLIENGAADGPCHIHGLDELRAVCNFLQRHIARVKRSAASAQHPS